MARPAVEPTRLGPELLVHQAGLAGGAEEAGAVPVMTFVTQVLIRPVFLSWVTLVGYLMARTTYNKDLLVHHHYY